MANFLLVHGAWHGGWCWTTLADRLRERGHRVVTPTLTGLADRSHLFSAEVGLETHITDVINTARWEELGDLVLCGHSYGGMVISGAAEKLEEQLRGIVYIDAFFPENGQSCSDLSGNAPDRNSAMPPPPAEMLSIADPVGRAQVERLMTPHPHPANTVLDSVVLTGARERVARKAYVFAGAWETGFFVAPYKSLSQDPTWRVYNMPTGRHPMVDAPDALADLLIEVGT